MSPVEDVATAIAASVRANGWYIHQDARCIAVAPSAYDVSFCQLICKNESQAKRLAEMMRKPPEPVFEAMGLSPFPTFPSARKS